MIVGLSMFDVVLDRLRKERVDEPTPRPTSWTGVRGLNASFVGVVTGQGSPRTKEQFAAAYSAYESDEFAPPPKPKPAIDVSHFKRLSPEEIAKDINILASDSPFELQFKRRSFARLNHPDRTTAEWREAATTRMKIANQMVDEALKKAASNRSR